MSSAKVKAGITVNDERIEASFYFDFGEDIDDAISKFGRKQAFLLMLREAKRKAKAAIRSELKAGTKPENIPEKLKDWRPDVKHEVVVKKEEEAETLWDSLDEEAKAEMIAKWKK